MSEINFWGLINSHLQGFSLVSDKKNTPTNNEISFCETQNEMMTLEGQNRGQMEQRCAFE